MRDQPGNEPKKGEMEALTVKLPEKSYSGLCLINTVGRTPGVINKISCKSEYITQPPSLAFGLGLDQWENM